MRKLSLVVTFVFIASGCGGYEETLGTQENTWSQHSSNAPAVNQEQGRFSTLTYNVAGLPEILSSAETDRQQATEEISCYINEFDFVNVQEDFNYHAALYDTRNNHPHRSPTSGGVPFGSGLNSLSRFTYTDWTRVKWNDCNGTDCLTPKGFTMARARLAEGVYVDIYNLHTQAHTEEADLEARRKNILQLVQYIDNESAGNAVIVLGDTNTRYTRSGDNFREFLNRGFHDAWVMLIRNGNVPASGADALVCERPRTSPNCEFVDKALYRDNGFVGLQPVNYAVREDAVNDEGVDLSDHYPIQIDWTFNTLANRRLSDQWGGPHGTSFNDVGLLPDNPVVSEATIRSDSRIDRVELTLANGTAFSHGGTGGTEHSLRLGSGEYIKSLRLSSGKKDGHTRIFYAEFVTNLERSLSGGSSTSDTVTYSAPQGWQIVGFHGRSDNEVDKLGVIYAPYQGN